jgi:hypothetical protein
MEIAAGRDVLVDIDARPIRQTKLGHPHEPVCETLADRGQ